MPVALPLVVCELVSALLPWNTWIGVPAVATRSTRANTPASRLTRTIGSAAPTSQRSVRP